MARRKQKNGTDSVGTRLESIDYHCGEIVKQTNALEKMGVPGTPLESIDYGIHRIQKAVDKIEKG